MTLIRTGKPIEPQREYTVAGWASVNEGTEGPPIWDVVMNHLAKKKVVAPKELTNVRVVGT
jgi:sulfur-oxidizing protein SoxB